MKTRVVIIGGGFGGISALLRLSKFKKYVQITLIDKKEDFNFLPVLPDTIGRGINPKSLIYNLKTLTRKLSCEFIKDEAVNIDLEKKIIYLLNGFTVYDYLILASGSETNFYGNESIKKYAYKLDCAEDAEKIMEEMQNDKYDVWFIGGGGYTGIEVATNLRRYFNKCRVHKKIIILEKSGQILGPLPEWMRQHVLDNLRKLNIEVVVNSGVAKIEEGRVYLASGETFDKVGVIWAAGVKTADYILNLKVEKNNQGRMKVDKSLKFTDKCFAVGDAANFYDQQLPLRMAVQFSIAEGETAAINVLKDIKGRRLKKYIPADLGYVIPLANNNSCGRILGINIKGKLPTLLHYLMCIYRSVGFKNKLRLVFDLLKGGIL